MARPSQSSRRRRLGLIDSRLRTRGRYGLRANHQHVRSRRCHAELPVAKKNISLSPGPKVYAAPAIEIPIANLDDWVARPADRSFGVGVAGPCGGFRRSRADACHPGKRPLSGSKTSSDGFTSGMLGSRPIPRFHRKPWVRWRTLARQFSFRVHSNEC